MGYGKKNSSIIKIDNKDIQDKIIEHTTQIADKMTKAPYHYYVGQIPMKYLTITDAVNAWIADGKPIGVIHISQGTYKEEINLSGTSNLSFIGEGKSLVTWKTTTGYYDNSPLVIGGNVLIKGITFIADTSDNPSYTYAPYSTANTGAAYALHVDDTTAVGEVVIEDCDLYSYQNAALGSGTRINQKIRLVNSRLYTYGNISDVKGYGAWLCHTSATAGATGQKISAKGCYFYSQYDKAVNIPSYGDNTPVPLDFQYCTLESGTITDPTQLVMFSYGAGATQIKTFMTKNSTGNNVESLNEPSSSWQKALLTQPNGLCVNVTDFNSAKYGFFMGNGAAGCLNTPTSAWYVGEAVSYSSSYIIQYAWAILDGFKKYRRTNSNGTWSAWTFLDESGTTGAASSTVQNEVTDFNAVTTARFKGNGAAGCLNTPTAAWYIGEQFSFSDTTYKVQYVWAILDSYKKYKRTYNDSGSGWTTWTLITEP